MSRVLGFRGLGFKVVAFRGLKVRATTAGWKV